MSKRIETSSIRLFMFFDTSLLLDGIQIFIYVEQINTAASIYIYFFFFMSTCIHIEQMSFIGKIEEVLTEKKMNDKHSIYYVLEDKLNEIVP